MTEILLGKGVKLKKQNQYIRIREIPACQMCKQIIYFSIKQQVKSIYRGALNT
jgi:hypothetical protein